MKKYILFFSILSLILLGFNANSARAYDSGCTSAGPYSVTTGQFCSTIQSTVCAPGDLFSSLTGQPCEGTPPIFSCTLSNFQIGSRGDDVKTLQTQLNTQGANLNVDGSYGPLTQAASMRYCKTYPPYNNQAPVISGVSGPQSLGVNQQGTWTVTASNPNGGNLSYSVTWGDEALNTTFGQPNFLNAVGQTGTFTHTYYQAGIFKTIFTVTSENTIRCIQAPCPTNGGSAQTSLSVNVGNVNNYSSLTVFSPNGGETWMKGTTQTIRWQDNIGYPTCPFGATCLNQNIQVLKYYDITLQSYYPPCTTNMCPMYAIRAPYTIANGVYGSSYSWLVGNVVNTYGGAISDGQYTIQVCQSGTSICDSSDAPFNIYTYNPM